MAILSSPDEGFASYVSLVLTRFTKPTRLSDAARKDQRDQSRFRHAVVKASVDGTPALSNTLVLLAGRPLAHDVTEGSPSVQIRICTTSLFIFPRHLKSGFQTIRTPYSPCSPFKSSVTTA